MGLMHDHPNIIGGERVAWAAAIVLGCILLYVAAMLIWNFSPSDSAAADPHVVAGFFSN
jgi:hypothetical protein